jgi:hypothetical protein
MLLLLCNSFVVRPKIIEMVCLTLFFPLLCRSLFVIVSFDAPNTTMNHYQSWKWGKHMTISWRLLGDDNDKKYFMNNVNVHLSATLSQSLQQQQQK